MIEKYFTLLLLAHSYEIMSKDIGIAEEVIASKIYRIRNQKVMLDSELTELYGVGTKALKRAVRRNIEIFPEHFMFELTKKEYESLRYQFGTSNTGRGGTRYLPTVFTEHGLSMLPIYYVVREPEK